VHTNYPSLVNGEFCDRISIHDRGLAYGDGVFETIRIINGRILFFNDHIQRMEWGLKRLSIPCSEQLSKQISTDIEKLLTCLELKSEYSIIVKVIITRGVGGRGYRSLSGSVTNRILSLHHNPYHIKAKEVGIESANSFKVIICQHHLAENSLLAGVKHLNRLDQVLASQELSDDIDEGILLDSHKNVIEGTKSNIVLLKDGRWFTPVLSQCGIRGIMLQKVIEWIQQRNEEFNQEQIPVKNIHNFNHIFMMNTVMGVRNVSQLNQHCFSVPLQFKELDLYLNKQFGYPKNQY